VINSKMKMGYTVMMFDQASGKFSLHLAAIPGKWIQNRGAKSHPCDGLCKEHFDVGVWYFKLPDFGAFCEHCAESMLGVVRGKLNLEPGPDGPTDCVHRACEWPAHDCPFFSCPRGPKA